MPGTNQKVLGTFAAKATPCCLGLGAVRVSSVEALDIRGIPASAV
jgi:hypothetical protein